MKIRILGIPIKIEISFLVMAVFLGILGRSEPAFVVEWALVVFVSVLFHELGHALVGRSFGLTPSIQLYTMGGLTSWTENRRLSPIKSIAISLAGPGAGFLFGGIIFLAAPGSAGSPLLTQTVKDLLFVNFWWGLINLLPILPLDGGNVVRSLEELITRKPAAIFSRAVSLLFAGLGGSWAIATGERWIAFLALLFAYTNGSAIVQLLRHRADQSRRPALNQAWESLKGGDGAAAVRAAEQVIEVAKSDSLRREAMELVIRGYIQQGSYEQATERLNKFQALFGPDPCLQGLLLLETGEIQRAINTLTDAFEKTKLPRDGYMLAHALTKSKRFDEALELSSDPALAEFLAPICLGIQAEAYDDREYVASATAGSIAFGQKREPGIAYNVACALSQASRFDEAVLWVAAALQSGFSDKSLLVTDPDLAGLRGRPDFDRLLTQNQPAPTV
jgi:Zn-dependent protease